MPLLGFTRKFKPAIVAGVKTQTIRRRRKYPIKEGDTLYIYVGLRTKSAERLLTAKCTRTVPVYIGWREVVCDGEKVTDLDAFAIADGFTDWFEMRHWFLGVHGLPFDDGVLIAWGGDDA